MTTIFTTICIGLIVFAGWKLTARGAYESAEYSVVESQGNFEIREYVELLVASTDMEFAQRGEDGSFMRLFKYISGAKIASERSR